MSWLLLIKDTKMVRLLTTFILTSCVLFSFGQNAIKKNNLAYFELGGNGLFLSLNYERQVIKNTNLNFHIGSGIYGIKPTYLTIPFGLNYLLHLKDNRSFIDFGFGLTYTKANVKLYAIVDNKFNEPIDQTDFNVIPSISYRHYSSKDWMFKVSLTPVFNQYDGLPFVGVSVGKLF